MRNVTMLLGLAAATTLSGCPALDMGEGEKANPEEVNVEEMGDEGAETEGAAAEAAEAHMPAPMALADVLGARADHMGKEVTVAGMYGGSAASGDMMKVTVNASADKGAASITCMASGPAWGEMAANSAVTVHGTLSEMDGKAILKNCMKAKPAAAEEALDDHAGGADAMEEGEDEGAE